ncbi:MAG: hypothetical protein ABR926_13650 [Streptosporangiaceae bacterium]
MRRRPAPLPSAQQMIREYLGHVSDAATKVLPKGDRLLFVGRTRAAIEAQVGPLASAEADDVLSTLTALGEPEDLAKRERERLYSARRRGAAAAPPTLWKPSKESRRGPAPAPAAARRAGPAEARKPRAWPHRGLTGPDEPKPAESGTPAPQPEPAPAVPRQADSPEATAVPAKTPAARTPPVETPAILPPTEESPSVDAPMAGMPTTESPTVAVPPGTTPGPGQSGPGQSGPGQSGPGQSGPGQSETGQSETEPAGTPPGWMRPVRPAPASGETEPLSIVPGMGQAGEAEEAPQTRRSSPAAAPLAEAWALARKHPLEAVAVVLLGLGGLILPFPFWLIGGLVALRSRRWDARDKWMALAGPPLFTLAVLLIRAGTSPGNFFSDFYRARHDVGLSIRAGCVLCASYLVWRLRRGPRLRTLPPWQRPR